MLEKKIITYIGLVRTTENIPNQQPLQLTTT